MRVALAYTHNVYLFKIKGTPDLFSTAPQIAARVFRESDAAAISIRTIDTVVYIHG